MYIFIFPQIGLVYYCYLLFICDSIKLKSVLIPSFACSCSHARAHMTLDVAEELSTDTNKKKQNSPSDLGRFNKETFSVKLGEPRVTPCVLLTSWPIYWRGISSGQLADGGQVLWAGLLSSWWLESISVFVTVTPQFRSLTDASW